MSLRLPDNIDAELELGPFRVSAIEHPGTRMDLDANLPALIRLVARARGHTDAAGEAMIAASYKLGPLRAGELALFGRLADELVALVSFRHLLIADTPILHISNAVVLPEHHGRGLMEALALFGLAHARARTDPSLLAAGGDGHWVTLLSQSPVVYAIFHRRAELWPKLDGSQVPESVLTLARAVAKLFAPEITLDERRLVLPGECSFRYATPPRSHDAAVNADFDERLDAARGDSVLIVAHLRELSARPSWQAAQQLWQRVAWPSS